MDHQAWTKVYCLSEIFISVGIIYAGYLCLMIVRNEPRHDKMPYANNKGTDLPIYAVWSASTFIVHCLDSIISVVSIFAISWLSLASVAEQAGLYLTWSDTPEDRFSRGVAQI